MLVEIEHLRLSLGGVPILKDVNLSFAEGEIYGLLGPNGAGKSTTIAATLGLIKPDAGTVRLLGRDPFAASARLHGEIGVLLEQNGFYDWMTGEDYLRFFADLYGCRPTAGGISRRLAAVGLEPRPQQTIGTYSRGMRQRLGLARALIVAPKLLILDEPTNGLDPRGRREFHDILLALARDGVGILMCTHLLDDVDRLCRRVGMIVDGRTVAEGAVAELIGESDHSERYRLRLAGSLADTPTEGRHVTVVAREGEWLIVDLDPSMSPNVVWRELLFSGWPITEIRRAGGGLEDLYLTLTERRAA